MTFHYAFDILIADILAKREDHSQLFIEDISRLLQSTQAQIELDRQARHHITTVSKEIKLWLEVVPVAQDQTVPPPAQLVLNPPKIAVRASCVQEPTRKEVSFVRSKRPSPIETLKAWRTRTSRFFNRIVQRGPNNSIHSLTFHNNGSASIPHQADENTGSEFVEDCPQELQTPKNGLRAMKVAWPKHDVNNSASMPNQTDETGGEAVEDPAPEEPHARKKVIHGLNDFESAWIKHNANGSTDIQLSTVDSIGGEVTECDLAPQEQKPRKQMFKCFKKFGAAALKLFQKRETPNKRKKHIIGFLNGSKPLPPSFSQNYKLGKPVAEGGFGVVVRATRLMDGREVAVKFIDTEKIPREMWLPIPSHPNGNLVPPEVAILHQLQHPGVIQYLDHVVVSKSHTLLITEFHGHEWNPPSCSASTSNSTLAADDGLGAPAAVDLFECFRAKNHLSEAVARKVFAQIALVVQYLHAQDIVHRDIKDVNIVIDSTYTIKLIDFGSAAAIPKSRYFTGLFGTITYASPEELLEIPYSGPEAEMWSLGVLLYTMVFGENPFPTTADTLGSHFKMPQGFPLDSDKESQGCRDLIRGLLNYFSTDRMTIEEVLEHPWMKTEVEFYRKECLSAA
ncbi:hypothetical protein HDU81_002330 [Chytriomyces hyalinus]|nr:hypothetical protein HDU81_002330 [Chytriomyces hyalinus]